jgi:hypothetical protein
MMDPITATTNVPNETSSPATRNVSQDAQLQLPVIRNYEGLPFRHVCGEGLADLSIGIINEKSEHSMINEKRAQHDQ